MGSSVGWLGGKWRACATASSGRIPSACAGQETDKRIRTHTITIKCAVIQIRSTNHCYSYPWRAWWYPSIAPFRSPIRCLRDG